MITFVFNEEAILEQQLREWVKQFQTFSNNFEIVLVNDGSTDKSREILDRLDEEFSQLVVIHHETNQGIGYAIRTARQNLSKDYVFWNDIDAHFSLEDMEKVIPYLKDYDIVVGVKHDTVYTKKGNIHWLKSRVNFHLIKTLFLSPIQDFQFVQFFPVKFFKEGMELESYSSFIPAECLVKARSLGFSIMQIQLFYTTGEIDGRVSKSNNVKTVLTSIKNIFSFWLSWSLLGGRRRARNYWHDKFGNTLPWQK